VVAPEDPVVRKVKGEAMKRMIAVFAGALVATATIATAVVTTASAGTAVPAAASCNIHWGSQPKSGGSLRTAPLIAARTSRHGCYDQVVFEFNGRATGYRVSYGHPVTEGAGFAMAPYLAGGAFLNVVLLDPADNIHTGAITYAHTSGDHVANVLRYRTLRDLMYGGSFEGYTTFGVGVRARLPFRVFVLSGPGTHTRIVLDIAHRWMH
jgi:hypothetical protein